MDARQTYTYVSSRRDHCRAACPLWDLSDVRLDSSIRPLSAQTCRGYRCRGRSLLRWTLREAALRQGFREAAARAYRIRASKCPALRFAFADLPSALTCDSSLVTGMAVAMALHRFRMNASRSRNLRFGRASSDHFMDPAPRACTSAQRTKRHLQFDTALSRRKLCSNRLCRFVANCHSEPVVRCGVRRKIGAPSTCRFSYFHGSFNISDLCYFCQSSREVSMAALGARFF